MNWIHTVCSEGVTALQVISFQVFPPPPTLLLLLLCVVLISYTVTMQLLQVGVFIAFCISQHRLQNQLHQFAL